LFWTVPQTPAVHGFVGVQAQLPPLQASPPVQATHASPPVPQAVSLVPG
jgi:hypothetical protein